MIDSKIDSFFSGVVERRQRGGPREDKLVRDAGLLLQPIQIWRLENCDKYEKKREDAELN